MNVDDSSPQVAVV